MEGWLAKEDTNRGEKRRESCEREGELYVWRVEEESFMVFSSFVDIGGGFKAFEAEQGFTGERYSRV